MLVAVKKLSESKYLVADMDDLDDVVEKDYTEIVSNSAEYVGVSKDGRIRCFSSTWDIINFDTARRKIAGYQLLYDVDFDDVTLNGCSGRMPKLLKIPEFVTNIENIRKIIMSMPEESVVTIPKSVKDISAQEWYMYDVIYSIKRLEIDATAPLVGRLFVNISSLEEVIIGSNVISIRDGVFMRCHNLRKIIIKDGLTSFGLDSLAYTDVERLSLPASVREFALGWQADELAKSKIKRLRMTNTLYKKYQSDIDKSFDRCRGIGNGFVELIRE